MQFLTRAVTQSPSTFALFTLLAALFSALPALAAAPYDVAARELADSAINTDYLSGKPQLAERKLRRALKGCEQEQCSKQIRARLYRDLGVVCIAGLNRQKEGREALSKAVQADPAIRLNADLTTPEVAQAFRDVGGKGVSLAAQPAPTAAPKRAEPAPKKRRGNRRQLQPEDITLEETPQESEESHEETSEQGASRLRSAWWFSFGLQQDFFVHSSVDNVCSTGKYQCFDASRKRYTGPILASPKGNRASGGLGIATTRVLLGADRRLLDNWLIGVRLGFAFGGAPDPGNGDKFLPLHLEVRGTYVYGKRPLERDGLRPLAQLALGIAEIDAQTAVDYYTDEASFAAGNKGVLDAWRKTGKVFIAPSLGAAYGFLRQHNLFAEARLMVLLGTSGVAPAFGLGYAHGPLNFGF